MRTIKKLISFITTTALLLSLLTLNVSAASLSVDTGVENLSASQSSFSIAVSVDSIGYSAASVSFEVSYDESVLILTNVTTVAAGTKVNYAPISGAQRVVGVANGENVLTGGELVTLSFTYGGKAGSSSSITLDNGTIVVVADSRTGEVSSYDIAGTTINVSKAASSSSNNSSSSDDDDSSNTSSSNSSSNSSSSSGSSSSTTQVAEQEGETIALEGEETPLSAVVVSESGIISGYPDGTFKPNATITRAEIITMINKTVIIDREDISKEMINPFTDLVSSHWAYEEILSASK